MKEEVQVLGAGAVTPWMLEGFGFRLRTTLYLFLATSESPSLQELHSTACLPVAYHRVSQWSGYSSSSMKV